MSRSPLFLLSFAAAMLALGDVYAKAPAAAPAPEPPLPGEEGPVSPDEAFSLLPGPNDSPPEPLPPGEENPVVPPPEAAAMDQLPDIEPLGLPSDGEPMPELPKVPGLVLPRQPKARPAAPSQNGDWNPAFKPTEPLTDVLPGGIELAKRARWYRSPIEAHKASIAEKKPLLMFFAQRREGLCPSILLNDDLFNVANADFNEFAAANLILTKLQFPGVAHPSASEYPEAKIEALKKFQEYFKVKGFPTLILMDETGRELKRIKGYRRVKDKSEQEYSTANVVLDQLKEAMRLYQERRRYQQQRLDNLISQGYRQWTSRAGSTMMGKLVDANVERIVLKDENGRWRQVLPAQLILFDAEWARRKQAGLIPEKPAAQRLAAANPPPAAAAPDPAESPPETPAADSEEPAAEVVSKERLLPPPAIRVNPRYPSNSLGGMPAGR